MARINRKKHIIDAAGKAPGRIATEVSRLLTGKHKPSYETYLDNGDKVTITNADQVVFTGKKIDQKIYRHHSMHPGGLKETPAKTIMKKDPKEAIRHAVEKMLPKNKMRNNRMKRLSFK